MNPETNRFEELHDLVAEESEDSLFPGIGESTFVRTDGSPVPKQWAVFGIGEVFVIKGYTFRVAYVGETAILFEPVAPPITEELLMGDSKVAGINKDELLFFSRFLADKINHRLVMEAEESAIEPVVGITADEIKSIIQEYED